MLYCLVLGVCMMTWMSFENMRYSFVKRYYAGTMLAFYAACFILKRPLSIVSSMIDSCRIAMYHSHSRASFNDISIELLSEWICSVAYYSFITFRGIPVSDESDNTITNDNKYVSMFITLFVHLLSESYATLIQPLPWYFAAMKRLRARSEYIWDGHGNGDSKCSSCCYAMMRLTFGWYMNNFKRDCLYNQWRNRCSIDSTMRLSILLLTAVLTWSKTYVIYQSEYQFDTRSPEYKGRIIQQSFVYFIIRQCFELLLFAFTWLYFYRNYQFMPFQPFVILTSRCKNPRYLFVLFSSFACYVQVMYSN